jgi:hypothetical protein
MAFKIEDGMGSRNRASIFNDRLRTFSTETSLIGHTSAERSSPLPHETIIGTFEARISSSVAGSGGSLLYFVNNDTRHFVIVDRIFITEVSCAIQTPDPNVYVSLLMNSTVDINTGTSLIAYNTNQSIINIQPDITILNGATTSGGVESMRKYLNISNPYPRELVVQKSDGIIIGNQNAMEVRLISNASANISTSMRFCVMNIEKMGNVSKTI